MLINFIKHNRAISIFFLPVAIAAFWIYGFINPFVPNVEYATPMFKAIISRLKDYPFLLTIISSVLIISEAVFINYLVRKNEIIDTTTYLPALVYIVLMSLQPEMLSLHPIVLANFFLLFALYKLMQTYKQETAYSEAFDTGLFISMASIFYMPSVIFVFILWIGLIIIRPFIWREWIISIMGFATPWIFVAFYYFWTNSLGELQTDIISNTFFLQEKSSKSISLSLNNYLQLGILILIAGFAIGRFLIDLGKSTVRIRNNNFLLVYFSILSVITIFIAPAYTILFLSFLSIPFSIFISGYFLLAKKQWIAEILFLLLIISVFINQIFQ